MSGTTPHRLAASLRRLGGRENRSEFHLPDISTGSEQLKGEYTRSQRPSPQPKRGIKDKFKELFTSHSKGSSQTNSPALQAENIHPTEPSNSVPSITVIAPQDQVSSDTPHKEAPSDQINALDLATVDAAREDANRAASAMRVIGAPVQSAISAINNADNPIPLVDSISNFLKTLSSFNSVVDKIAPVHPYVQAAWTVLSFAPKTIIEQTTRDDSIRSLLSKMEGVYTFLTQAELQDIEFMKTVVERIYRQTLECSYFIREYSQNKQFRTRLLKNFISETDARVKCYNDIFDELLQQFRDKATGNTLVVVHRIWEDLGAQAEDSDLNSIPYVRGAGLDTQKICLEGTRHEILEEITTWINNTEDNTTRILWLHGEAGTGKSSIAHTIADRFKKLGRLGSCYCFDRNQMAAQRDKNIFTTIARDLADRDKQMRRELANAIHQDTSLKNTTDIQQQWKELIMKPAQTFSETMAGPIVIVIDALDESGMVASRQHLLRILAGKLDDDESLITKLPPHIRILLTSRPLPDITNALNGVGHVQSKSMFSIPPALSQRDISRYVSRELSGLEGIEIEDASASLTAASDRLFEWARLACAYVKGDDVAGLTVKERFEAIITHDRGHHVPLLDSMYKLTLEGIFPLNQDKRPLDRFRSVMEQILGMAEPLPLISLRSIRHYFISEDLQEIDINTIVKPLGALLSGITDASAVIRPLHSSFSEFLTDKDRSGEYFIDLSHIHQDLAGASLGVMQVGLQFNICQLPTSYLPNSEIPDLDERIKQYISPELSYACRFWTDHLQNAQFDLALAKAIQAFFNHERLLFWLEVLSLLKRINSCASGLSCVIQWAMAHAECKDIISDASDAQKFVRMFGGPISFSTPHLYLSALPFSPKNSQISKKFSNRFPQVLKHISEHNLSWPIIQHILHGHAEEVLSVAFSSDGKRIVSGSDDKTIQLWDAETGEMLGPPFEGHEGSVSSVAFSPDRKCIVSGSYDQTVQLWDAETGEMLRPPLEGHKDSVRSVAFSPDGKCIVSGSEDKTVRLWDAKTGEMLQSPLEGHENWVQSVAFSPDGKCIVSGSDDKTIRLWDAQTGEMLQPPLEGHEAEVWSVAFSPDGKCIASGSCDKTIRLWDAETREILRPPLESHKDWVQSVAFSPDGKCIVSGSYDQTIRLWDAKTGEMLRPPLEGHEDYISSVAFSPDSKRIVSGSFDMTIQLSNAETEEMLQSSLEGHRGPVTFIAFSPDGKHIVSGSSDKTIRLWDAQTGEMLQPVLEGHEDWIQCVAYSPDGQHIVSGSEDTTIRLWDAKTGEMLQPSFEGHESDVLSVTFSPDGKCIVSGSSDKTIRLWDAETGEMLRDPLEGHEDSVTSVVFSPDSKCIVSGSEDKTIQLWDAKTGEMLRPPLEGHENRVGSVAFSPDGKYIVSGSEDKTIRLWDAQTGEMLQPPLGGHEAEVSSVAFSPDSKCIVSGSEDKTIQLWDAQTGEMLRPPLEGHKDSVWSVAFSPDGKCIVSGSEDKTIRLWNVKTGEMLQHPLKGYENQVQSAAFSPYSKSIVSGSVLEGQHLVLFSPHPEHALTNVTELLYDITSSSQYKLVQVQNSGWLHIGPKNKILLWIPPFYHLPWYSPNTHMIIPVPDSLLDLSNMAHGSSWELCYLKET